MSQSTIIKVLFLAGLLLAVANAVLPALGVSASVVGQLSVLGSTLVMMLAGLTKQKPDWLSSIDPTFTNLLGKIGATLGGLVAVAGQFAPFFSTQPVFGKVVTIAGALAAAFATYIHTAQPAEVPAASTHVAPKA